MPIFYLIFRDDRLRGSWVVAGLKFIISHFDFAGRQLLQQSHTTVFFFLVANS